MSARDAILKRVREACDKDGQRAATHTLNVESGSRSNTKPNSGPNPEPNSESLVSKKWEQLVSTFPADVQTRLTQPARHTQPDVPDNLTDALLAQMEAVQMSVVRLQSLDDVTAAVDWYRQEQGLSGELCVAPSLNALSWSKDTRFGPATGATVTSVSKALVAVAETGSVALASGEQSPATLNFLPENHIIVLHESQIVRSTEDVWQSVRHLDALPRAINFVTGPSRTGDIEQTIELGAHGPRRMHVLLIAEKMTS